MATYEQALERCATKRAEVLNSLAVLAGMREASPEPCQKLQLARRSERHPRYWQRLSQALRRLGRALLAID